MKHKDKVKLAKSMMTVKDRKAKKSHFSTDAWLHRKEAIKKRVEKKQDKKK